MTLPETARLVIVRFSSLGDVVKCTSLPRLIKARYPRSHLTFVTASDYTELIVGNPHVDRVIGLDRKSGLAGVVRLARDLGKSRVDLLVDVHKSLRSRLLRLLLRVPRVAYSKRTSQRWLLIQFGVNTYRPPMGKEFDFAAVLRPWGIQDDGLGTELHVERLAKEPEVQRKLAPELEILQRWCDSRRSILGLAPMAAWDLKRWPLEHFRTLAEHFLRATGGAVMVFGGPGDTDAQALADDLGTAGLSLVGRTSHAESAFLAGLTDVMVTNDTGMMHLAEAVGRDVIALFGPTTRELGYFPTRGGSLVMERDLPCRPCSRMGEGRCTHPDLKSCLTGITPDAVFLRVMEQLARPHSAPGGRGVTLTGIGIERR